MGAQMDEVELKPNRMRKRGADARGSVPFCSHLTFNHPVFVFLYFYFVLFFLGCFFFLPYIKKECEGEKND